MIFFCMLSPLALQPASSGPAPRMTPIYTSGPSSIFSFRPHTHLQFGGFMNPLVMPAIVRGKQSSTLRFMQATLPAWEDVAALYRDVYKSGIITNAELVERLESSVAERLRVKHCIAVSSCTSGLILVFKALGLS